MAFEQSQAKLFKYRLAGSVAEAKKILSEELFDVIIADYSLGDGTAFDILEFAAGTPVIFVTTANDLNLAVKAMKYGAYDYLVKDLDRNYLGLLPHVVQKAIAHRKANEELAQARIQVEESLKVKEQFLNNMSHEIRTPINAIVGFTDLLGKTTLDEEQRTYLHAIQTSGDNLVSLVNDILNFSKLKSGKLEIESIHFRLSEVISSVTELLMLKAVEKGIKFSSERDPSIPDELIGDPTRLAQILLNLAGNAIKFTDTGEVKIAVKKESETEQAITINFSVSDTGIGIPEEKLFTIFDEFVQASSSTTRKYGGSGLGLSIVKQLVDLQHGVIAVQSKPGKGSIFNFSLTYQKTKQNQMLNGASDFPEKEDVFEGLRVLVVEDNLLNQILAKKYLNDMGCKVEIAENGVIAIQKLEEKEFDIVLMDIQMPEMDGYQATRRIRERKDKKYGSIPILAMTAHDMKGEKEKCVGAGMNGYIAKPIHREVLKERILELLNRGHMINMDVIKKFIGSDQKFIDHLMKKFMDESGPRMEKLLAETEKKNWPEVRTIAHRMLSSTRILHLRALSGMLESIELMAEEKKEEEKITLLVSNASDTLNRAVAEIKKLVQ